MRTTFESTSNTKFNSNIVLNLARYVTPDSVIRLLFDTMARAGLMIVATFVCAILSVCLATAEVPDWSSMRIKELKAFIAKKGTECLACSSKEDLIERANEVKDWPDVEEKKPETEEVDPDKMKDILNELGSSEEKMQKLREELEKAGLDLSKMGGNGKIFDKEDLEKVFKKVDLGKEGEKKSEDAEQPAADNGEKEEL